MTWIKSRFRLTKPPFYPLSYEDQIRGGRIHSNSFRQMYARGREKQADHMFDQAWIEGKKANAYNYNAVRLRVDS